MKKMKRMMMVALMLAVAAACCAQTPAAAKKQGPKPDPKMPFTKQPDATAETIMQLEREASRAMQDRGVDGWMEFVAENAIEASGPGHPSAVGRDAIRASMLEETKGGKLTWVPTHAEVFKGATLAYAVGRYTFTSDDAKVAPAHGTYLTMWQKQEDRSWKVVYDTGSPEPATKE